MYQSQLFSEESCELWYMQLKCLITHEKDKMTFSSWLQSEPSRHKPHAQWHFAVKCVHYWTVLLSFVGQASLQKILITQKLTFQKGAMNFDYGYMHHCISSICLWQTIANQAFGCKFNNTSCVYICNDKTDQMMGAKIVCQISVVSIRAVEYVLLFPIQSTQSEDHVKITCG